MCFHWAPLAPVVGVGPGVGSESVGVHGPPVALVAAWLELFKLVATATVANVGDAVTVGPHWQGPLQLPVPGDILQLEVASLVCNVHRECMCCSGH